MRVWRVWYGPGDSVVVRGVEDWPVRDGMQGAVEYLEPPYRNVISGADWYVWDDGIERGPGGAPGTWAPRPESGDPVQSGPSLPGPLWDELVREMLGATCRPY